MNQDWQEKKLKSLFSEIRREDERRAPPFSYVLNKPQPVSDPPRIVPRFAFAVVALIVLAGVGLFMSRGLMKPLTMEAGVVGEGVVETPHQALVPAIVCPPRQSLQAENRRVARRRIIKREIDTSLISRWQAPTDFLLATPGEELLKKVPSIGQSSEFVKILRESY